MAPDAPRALAPRQAFREAVGARVPLKLSFVFGVAALAMVQSSPLAAQPAPEAVPQLIVSGTCPQAVAVRSLLSTLVPESAVGARTPVATVSDLDTRFLVAVAERRKIYADPARDCARRARVAAAFIALALLPEGSEPAQAQPPSVAPEPQPPPEPPVARLPIASSPAGAHDWASVDVRGAFALGLPNAVWAPGVLVRAAGGREWLGGHASCGWFFGASTTLSGETGSVLLQRLPCDAGATVRFSWLGRRLDTAIDAGFAVGLLEASGRGFAATYASSHVELGGRVAVDTSLRLDPWRVSLMPVVGIEATAYTTSYDFDVTPHGVVGRAPLVWTAITAGVRLGADFRP